MIPCTYSEECVYVAQDTDDLNEHLDDEHNARRELIERIVGAAYS